jgi:DNA-binding transcriptional ArsR family regulator
MRSSEEVRLVHRLAAEGLNASEIARRTGIPRRTIGHWLSGSLPHSALAASSCPRCGGSHEIDRLAPATYAYAFGLYLGDGCILKQPKGVWRLEIAMDSRYPALILWCANALQQVMPKSRVSINDQGDRGNYVIVRSYSKAWPCLFPQHGPGLKHKRKIALEPWQDRIVDAQPEQFVRGLIHSDGCRVLNRVNGKAYPRYHFTQVSDDIRRLFCRSLRQLGIDYTWNDARNVSIARRPSVARLDEFVGPKR